MSEHVPEKPGPGKRKGRRPSRGSLTSVSSVLSKVIGKYGLDRRMKEHAFMSMWHELVDPPFRKISRPLFIDHEANLVVAVKDASAAQELSFHRGGLISKLAPLARGVGLNVKGIRIDLKNFKEEDEQIPTKTSLPVPTRPEPEELAAVELSPSDLEDLNTLRTELAATETSEVQPGLNAGTVERIIRLYERELRLKVFREQKGLPACSQCGFVDSRLYGAMSLCRLCHVMSLAGRDS